MKDFNFKLGDLELRTCGNSLFKEENTTAEIVYWMNDDSCYTVAYWIKDDDYFSLKFVVDRPFNKDIAMNDFFRLAKMGTEFLNE